MLYVGIKLLLSRFDCTKPCPRLAGFGTYWFWPLFFVLSCFLFFFFIFSLFLSLIWNVTPSAFKINTGFFLLGKPSPPPLHEYCIVSLFFFLFAVRLCMCECFFFFFSCLGVLASSSWQSYIAGRRPCVAFFFVYDVYQRLVVSRQGVILLCSLLRRARWGWSLWGLGQVPSEAELAAWYRREAVCIERGDMGLALQY